MITFLAFLFGLLIGSFLNVCIHRWPREESVIKPRSHCPRCAAPVGWYDNIPVVSYLLLRGRCRRCGEPISIRYPIVELLNAVLYAAILDHYGLQPVAFKACLFSSMMLILFFTDLAEYILPDEVTIGGAVIGLALSLFIHVEAGLARLIFLIAGIEVPPALVSFADAMLSAVIMGGLLLLVGEVYYRLRHIEGLGLGDVKMVAMIATFWGLSSTVLIMILSSFVGAITGILIVLIGRKKWTYALPFGSYLAATSILVAIWGDAILTWYWNRVMPPQ